MLSKNIYNATVLQRTLLSKNTDDNRVYLIRFSWPKNQPFKPGDIAFVCPKNDPKWVNRILEILKANPQASVQNEQNEIFSFYEALQSQYELQLRPQILEKIPNAKVNDFWSCLKILHKQHAKNFNEQMALTWFKPMRPRAYSIASAYTALPDALELIVKHVVYRDIKGGICEGFSSGFLCKRIAIGDTVNIYIVPSKFRLPADNTRPIIMVGPGTGIAPFKAFLEYRQHSQATGPSWLFFGGRHQTNDFILQDFLENLQQKNILTRLDLAFSRDQDHKIYVQDRMRTHAKELWDWLLQGAYFYICGDAKHMAKDVEQTLLDIIQQKERLSLEAAQIYLKDLRLAGRYQKDVY